MRAFLLANIEQWIGAIVTIASIVIYALNQAFDKSQEQQRQQEAARQKWLAEQRARNANPAAEVDSFLRDVAQGRKPQQPGRREVVTAEVVTAEVVRPEGPGRLSERHLQSQLGQHMAEFQQHVDRDVDTNDVKSHLDEQIHAKFDHKVGSLEQRPAQAEPQRAERARPEPQKAQRQQPKAKGKRTKAEVVQAQVVESGEPGGQPAADPGPGPIGMFSDPARFRQAFIMQEVLERPQW